MELTQPKDKFGNDILPESYILYPTRHGSNIYMRIGKVVYIKDDGTDYQGRLRWKLRIKTTREGYNWRENTETLDIGNESTLTCLERVVIIPDSIVPEKYKMVL